jgi:predicted transcriptional regulator YheO
MAKATIKSRTGAVITVEGTDAEVSSILATYERTTVVGQAKEAIARSRVQKRNTKKREGAADIIVALRETSFFDKPKELAEIATALEEKGYLYRTTTLSGVVLGLVKKKELRRKKQEGRWVYGK